VDAIDNEAAVALADIARQSGLDVTSDIDDITSRTGALIDSVTIPILAEHVPLALTGERDTERALRALRQRHPGRLVVTLGARGAAMLDGDQYIQVAGCPVTVIDSTGAGDVFRGAFIYALLRGDEPEQMLRFANAAAALSCTRAGAMDAIPSLNAVQALMRPTA
jgi:sugar/nucleoside kinase (ribokinase family)